jgi:hypothetical protein
MKMFQKIKNWVLYQSERKIIIDSIRDYYNYEYNGNLPISNAKTYPYLVDMANGNIEIIDGRTVVVRSKSPYGDEPQVDEGTDIFAMILKKYIYQKHGFKVHGTTNSIKKTFKYLIKRKKFYGEGKDKGMEKFIPTDFFLAEKPFWNYDRVGIVIAILISIIALFV